MPLYVFLIPQMTFTRLFYHLCAACMNQACIQNLDGFEDEAIRALIVFYITPFMYFFLGFYINMRTVKHQESYLTS